MIRVGFAGTPPFAATALGAILDAGFHVPVVLTRPARPHGRGLKISPSPVRTLAEARGIRVLEPPTLKTPDARAEALAIPLDVLVVAAYGLILPLEVLSWPRHGGINIHASLLPRWRGAAPIERAILAGDTETGITLMQMDEGLDTGSVVERVRVGIEPSDTAGTLTGRLAAAGATAIVAALARLEIGRLVASPQPTTGVTYARKIDKAEAMLDWQRPASDLERQIRAFDPVPGARSTLGGQGVKLWGARGAAEAATVPAGSVLSVDADGIVVACGEGALRITELQPAGGRRMEAAAFVAGHRLAPGMLFGADRV